VTHLEFNPAKEDLFTYIEELRRAVRRLDDLNQRLPENGRVVLNETYVRSRLIRAARQVPTYKSVIDSLIMLPIEEWSKLTVDQLYTKLQAAQANDASIAVMRTPHQVRASKNVSDETTANYAQTKPKTKKNTCNDFAKGSCKRGTNCIFSHNTSEVKPKDNEVKPAQTTKVCLKCGGAHLANECTFKGKCGWCNCKGHKEDLCYSKKNGKPKVLLTTSNEPTDGFEVKASMLKCDFTVGMSKPKPLSEVEPVCGSVKTIRPLQSV